MSASSNGFRRRDARFAAAAAAGGGHGTFGPNMTPMVDIVLVILVFFMAATAFIGEEWFLRSAIEAKQEHPAAATDAFELPPVRLEIVLDRGAVETLATGLGVERAPLATLPGRLAAFTRGTAVDQIEVMIRPAPEVPYEDVVRVHEACAAVGIEKIALGGR